MAFIEFRDVRKIYQMGEVEVAAVDGMSFTVEKGEFVVVVGELSDPNQAARIARKIIEQVGTPIPHTGQRLHTGCSIGISVNVSARQIVDGDFAAQVDRALAESGLAPAALVLEVTESLYMRVEPAVNVESLQYR